METLNFKEMNIIEKENIINEFKIELKTKDLKINEFQEIIKMLENESNSLKVYVNTIRKNLEENKKEKSELNFKMNQLREANEKMKNKMEFYKSNNESIENDKKRNTIHVLSDLITKEDKLINISTECQVVKLIINFFLINIFFFNNEMFVLGILIN